MKTIILCKVTSTPSFDTSKMDTNALEEKLMKSRLCPRCKKRFSTPSKAKRHFLAVHEKIREFQCDICTLAFNQKIHVLKHRQAVHKSELETNPHLLNVRNFRIDTVEPPITIDYEPMEMLILPESIKDVDINLDEIDTELLWLNLPNLTEKVPKANLSKTIKCDICNLKRKMLGDVDWLRLRMCIINQEHYACLNCGEQLCQTKGWKNHQMQHVRKK